MWSAREKVREGTISDVFKGLGFHTIVWILSWRQRRNTEKFKRVKEIRLVFDTVYFCTYTQYMQWCIVFSFLPLLVLIVLELVQVLVYHACETGDNLHKIFDLQFPPTGEILIHWYPTSCGCCYVPQCSDLNLPCLSLFFFFLPFCWRSVIFLLLTTYPSLLSFSFSLSIKIRTSHFQRYDSHLLCVVFLFWQFD